jgi:hypothetical protein
MKGQKSRSSERLFFFAFFPALGEAGEEDSKTSFSRGTRYNAGTERQARRSSAMWE